ncbi:MAG TPA: non-heme iron oxygenase ferredoxin subunit [Planctomycetota bacterium]|jgi:3-phenylpropionate/trans-cinnamate dioxygenase ferredoxin subunit
MAFVKALNASELPAGAVKCVALQGKKIAIFNVDGQYLAIDDTCSHEEASLSEGTTIKEGDRCAVECPEHGARFDLRTGKNLTLPATRPVKAYALREVNGVLEVEI